MIKTNLSELNTERYELNKIYRGIVEDNKDPLKLGRCKIRVWGIHTENKTKTDMDGIPTEELPWAEPAMGLFEGSISGFGMWSVPLQGSHVFLFFEAGNILQPRYFATVPGKPKERPNPKIGFSDPDDVYPTDERIGESDFHRLSRGGEEGKSKTITEHKNSNLDSGITTADGSSWDEPESAYNAEYPNNIVFVTHSGITIELDNTPGSERIHIFHPSNSYVEVDKDGKTVLKSANDKFEIVMGDKNVHIKSNLNTTIDLDENHYVKSNQTVKVDGEHDKTIGMNENIMVGMDRTENVGMNENRIVGMNQTENIGQSVVRNTGLTVTDIAGGVYTIQAPIIKLN